MVDATTPRFDNNAVIYLSDYIRRKAVETGIVATLRSVDRQITNLPRPWRKSMPILHKMALDMKLPRANKVRMFHLPKRIRRSKNPIYSWPRLIA
jgi:hypothetical protein